MARLQAGITHGDSFAIVGFILIRFQKSLGEFQYKRQIEAIKKRTSAEKMGENVKYMGTSMFFIGIIVITIGVIIYLT